MGSRKRISNETRRREQRGENDVRIAMGADPGGLMKALNALGYESYNEYLVDRINNS